MRANALKLLIFFHGPGTLKSFALKGLALKSLGRALVLVVLAGCSGPPKNLKASNTRVGLAKEYASKWELDAAESEARKALEFHSGNGDAHWLLGTIDFQRFSLSHKQLEMDQCLTGIDAQALLEDKDRFLTDADKHFADAVKLDPGHSEAWATRGGTAILRGRYDDAISYLERALADPSRLENIALVRMNLGWAHFHKGDMLPATKALLQVLQFQPGMCHATYYLGRVYFARKEWEKALQKFQEVTGNSQCRLQDPHLYMMKIYVELGATQKLSGAMQACVQMAPKSCTALKCQALSVSEVSPDPEGRLPDSHGGGQAP